MTTLRTSIVVGVLDFDYRTELDGTLQDALDVMVEYGAEVVPVDLPEPKRDRRAGRCADGGRFVTASFAETPHYSRQVRAHADLAADGAHS